MGVVGNYMDTMLVPLSAFLMIGYHAYLWHCFKNNPSQTTVGRNSLRRKAWLLAMKEGNDKKGLLAIQSLRNTQMATILTASLAILVNTALAALTNNVYNASHHHHHPLTNDLFGSQSSRVFILKFGSASLFLLASFLCSSMGLTFLVDANFLLNATTQDTWSCFEHKQIMFERGFGLALIGSRVLFCSLPLVVWMFGPLPVPLSSLALIWVFYGMDFCGNFSCSSIDIAWPPMDL